MIDWTLSLSLSLDFSFSFKIWCLFFILPLLPMPYLDPSVIVDWKPWPLQVTIVFLHFLWSEQYVYLYSIDSFVYISCVKMTQCFQFLSHSGESFSLSFYNLIISRKPVLISFFGSSCKDSMRRIILLLVNLFHLGVPLFLTLNYSQHFFASCKGFLCFLLKGMKVWLMKSSVLLEFEDLLEVGSP